MSLIEVGQPIKPLLRLAAEQGTDTKLHPNEREKNKMKVIRFATLSALALSLSFAAPAVAQEKDIVDVASSAGQFNTLVAAVKAAGLVDVLKGEGPFTVFAPTDAAFEKLPEGTVEDLLKPENRDKLKAILTYHVVPGKVMAEDVVKLSSAETVEGSKVNIRTKYGKVMVNDAQVVKADVQASNGVIHVIDTVILPTGE